MRRANCEFNINALNARYEIKWRKTRKQSPHMKPEVGLYFNNIYPCLHCNM
jgi:hypothetical protein